MQLQKEIINVLIQQPNEIIYPKDKRNDIKIHEMYF